MGRAGAEPGHAAAALSRLVLVEDGPDGVAVNGPAVAAGFALALLCDIRVAAASARVGFPELGRHIPPSYGAARAVLGEP